MQKSPTSQFPGLVSQALLALVTKTPTSTEKVAVVPAVRAQELARNAALKAAAISGGFTLPPGPLGMATVLPDLLAVWRVQQQLVADIAAAFGRPDAVTRETMIVCLFKHGGAAITQRLVSRGKDDDVVVHRIAHRALQQLLEKIAVRIGQRIAAKSASRWLPIIGALGAGAYAYYDTSHVATNALELFSKPLRIEGEPGEPTLVAAEAPPASRPARGTTRTRTTTRHTPGARRGSSPTTSARKSKPRQTRKRAMTSRKRAE